MHLTNPRKHNLCRRVRQNSEPHVIVRARTSPRTPRAPAEWVTAQRAFLLFSLVALLALSGCEALGGLNWPGGGGQGGGADPKDEGTFSATAEALWWMGLAATGAGIACLVLKLSGIKLMPSGTGLTAIVTGIPTMLAADVLAAHQEIAWVILALLLVVLVVELVGRQWIKRKLAGWVDSMRSGSQKA